MNDTQRPGIWSRIGRALTLIRVILSNLLFFGLLLVLIAFLMRSDRTVIVPDGAALLINPAGAVVEQPALFDPLQQWFSPGALSGETALRELLLALESAAGDDRIEMVLLDLDDLEILSLTHADALGQALLEFRDSGKPVVAYGGYFDQAQYLLASHADELYMHPYGQVMLPGFTVRQMYFKELLDRLKVNVHVFRVGVYKEFVEPYIRTDMSAEARVANQTLIDTLWNHFRDRVRVNRQMDPERFERYTQQYDEALLETRGDSARLALEYQLVDELLTPDQARARVGERVGFDADGELNGIDFAAYLRARGSAEGRLERRPQVGVITAQGPIMPSGQARGVIAADRLVELIRQAREDSSVGALVLRVHTPGGSSFASELIRQELEITQLSGKPVVVSMGPVAASGGYWIAATADAIVAEATTVTGSIGVFGILPTFEDSLASIGVQTDGVTTSSLGSMDLLSPLEDATARVLQAGTDHAYRQFIHLVARGRDLTVPQVEELAEGRIWLGSSALELGLIDRLGDEQTAVALAAELAGLEDFGLKRIEAPLSARERLLRELTGGVSGPVSGTSVPGVTGVLAQLWPGNEIGAPWRAPALTRQVGDLWMLLNGPNDPRNTYALCETCSLPGAASWIR